VTLGIVPDQGAVILAETMAEITFPFSKPRMEHSGFQVAAVNLQCKKALYREKNRVAIKGDVNIPPLAKMLTGRTLSHDGSKVRKTIKSLTRYPGFSHTRYLLPREEQGLPAAFDALPMPRLFFFDPTEETAIYSGCGLKRSTLAATGTRLPEF
jgi:hypothetical protein